jgi:hypothetical protein
MAFTNADKQQHGQSAQDSLENILKRCVDIGYLKCLHGNYRVGKEGYSNTTQFYTPFLIEFQDDTKWALFTTTSMRTDRIKGQQWDALNLKEIDNNIVGVYLVYPDGISDSGKAEFVRQNKKYINREEYSAIDAVVSQDEICNMIEEYAIKDLSTGQIKDIQGNSFESRIAAILSYAQNLNKWKNGAATIEGMHYDVFENIVNCFELDTLHTQSISATSDKKTIGRLPSGGNPKTDVLVTVEKDDGTTEKFTISCKRSSDKSVSVHQYTADAFADVLDRQNERLRQLLRLFQESGSLSAFGEENCNALTLELQPYKDKLSLWVLGGQGGDGNPDTQCADYILTYDNNDSSATIHRIQHYCEQISAASNGSFGTPFSWTYPSKRRGESIQLKCKILK